MTQATAEAEAGMDQEKSTASTTDAGEGSVFAARNLAAEVARVAHWLLNDKGYTRKRAAQSLATIARKMNSQSVPAWSNDDMRMMLGDAADIS